ncbi:hypothetical protein ABZX75_17325 [Streptomyces sp. NPDC003038]|uniref:hypothetical protein n=1 Tax=unclassified Streptomyces TaxID=2593676 RepID=UPI0033A5457A
MTGPGQSPDTSEGSPDNRGGTVRTSPVVGETTECGSLPTSADTVRTPPDTNPADSPDGVRVEYRARVPRRLLGAAFAEAFAAIAAAHEPPPASDREGTTP